jgi:capsular polysaccharide biosynthesis protein
MSDIRESITASLFNAGRAIAGEAGGDVANAVTSALGLGRIEPCTEECGYCNVPSSGSGSCDH